MKGMHNMGYDLRSEGYKGISPLIAAVLLIAITVAIATLVSGWISTVTRSAQVSVENKTTEAVECAAAAVTIDQVYFQVNNTVRISVRNSGQAANLLINNVTVANSTGHMFSFANVPVTLQRGDAYTFVITNPASTGSVIGRTCPTDFSKALVVTTCGGVFASFDKTPVCS